MHAVLICEVNCVNILQALDTEISITIMPCVCGTFLMNSFCSQEYLQRILKIDSDLQRVKGYIWEARAQWKNIGRALGISEGTINTIHVDDDESLHQILTRWIQSDRATIQDLLTALEDPTVGRNDIVNEILSRKGKSMYDMF